MRPLLLLTALTLACASPTAPVSGGPIMTAIAPATAVSAAAPLPNQTTEQRDIARCEWAKPTDGSSAPPIAEVHAKLDVVRLAIGLPPLTDAEKKADAEQQRLDDALEGTVGCEVREARGAMPASQYAFAIEEVLPEVARCLHQPGHAQTGKLVVRLAFDADGRASPARLEPANVEKKAAACVEGVFSALRPASDPETQANGAAVVELELRMPAVR